MTPKEVIIKLKNLSLKLGATKTINQKIIRTEPKLNYYIDYHFGTLGNALTEAGLQDRASSLALKMSVTNEKLLEYLGELKNKLRKDPTEMSITRDKSVYKKFSVKKFSYKIFRTRFGGVKEALKKLDGQVDQDKSSKDINQKVASDGQQTFQNKSRYYGKAAELHVTAELIYRGFQAANIPVDEGLDILAVKKYDTFYIQVKHKDLSTNLPVELTRSSYDREGRGRVFYIFVLLKPDNKNPENPGSRKFLIIQYHIFNDWIRKGLVKLSEDGKKYLIFFREDNDRIKLVNKESSIEQDVTEYNKWEDIR